MVTESESATFHLRVEFPPLATHESAVKDMTFGQGGGTKTGPHFNDGRLGNSLGRAAIVGDGESISVTRAFELIAVE